MSESHDAHMSARPLQIIALGEESENNGFKLREENLTEVISQIPAGMKVAIVSVVGAFRTGKSFLLTFFLRYLKDGDPEDKTDEWMTRSGPTIAEGNNNLDQFVHGNMQWSKPFIRRVPAYPEDIAILLMDTQGMFDHETSMSLTACIFGLSTLLSSYQVYNVDKHIQEDNLQHLALFSEYGRMGLHKEQEEECETKGQATTLPAQSDKPFQRLDFLVRDWQNYDDDDTVSIRPESADKLRSQMAEYLQSVISKRNVQDLVSTREQILRCYRKISCFMLPHPGTSVVRKNYNGDISKIDSGFKNLLDLLVRRVFDELLEPKQISGRYLTGPEVRYFTRAYVNMFREGAQFPRAMTMLEATAEANNQSAIELAIILYKKKLEVLAGPNSKGYVNERELEAVHADAFAQAIAKFQAVANMGPASLIENAKRKIIESIDEAWKMYHDSNSNRNPFKNAEVYVIAAAVGIGSFIVSVIFDSTCSSFSTLCDNTADLAKLIYWSILIVGMVVFWDKLKALYKYMLEVLPVLLNVSMGQKPS